MNIPSGDLIAETLPLKKLDVVKMLNDLVSSGFNGYVTVTVYETFGFEDGLLVFQSGKIKAAYYDYISKAMNYYGNQALEHIFNAFASENGVVEVYKLTPEQVTLLLTFNSKMKISDIDLNKLFVEKYTPKLNLDNTDDDKTNLLKKIGLGNIRL